MVHCWWSYDFSKPFAVDVWARETRGVGEGGGVGVVVLLSKVFGGDMQPISRKHASIKDISPNQNETDLKWRAALCQQDPRGIHNVHSFKSPWGCTCLELMNDIYNFWYSVLVLTQLSIPIVSSELFSFCTKNTSSMSFWHSAQAEANKAIVWFFVSLYMF